MGGWKEVVAEIQNELKNLKVPLCGRGRVLWKAREEKPRGPITSLFSLPSKSQIASNIYQ